MIVLPNTPSTPTSLKPAAGTQTQAVTPETLSLRAAIGSSLPANHAELAQYVLRLESYLENVFEDLVVQSSSDSPEEVAKTASAAKIAVNVPWNNVVAPKAKSLRLHKHTVEWTVSAEVVATILAVAESYMGLAADLIDDLIQQESPEDGTLTKDLDQKWRSVAEHYKSAISVLSYGARFQNAARSEGSEVFFNPSIFALFDKICNIGIQMSILCKSSWSNRAVFVTKESFTSSNNGVLCRVAIWVFNEVLACQNFIVELQKSSSEPGMLGLNYDKWANYLTVFFKYVSAYSGLFLAIEYYQKSKLGQAIGLLNYALLTLQSKNLGDVKKKGFDRLKGRISGRKNESFIANLQSVTSLDIEKSGFSDSSGAVVSDLSLLFDQLVLLHLKFSKENDNIRFDAVADWKDTRADSKWPLGAKIPVSPAKEYVPRAMSSYRPSGAKDRGSYY